MTTETVQLIREAIPAIAAIGGAAVGAAGGIAIAIIGRRSEERKHLRALAVNAGIENFKSCIDVAKRNGDTTVASLDKFIISSRYMSTLIEKPHMSPEELTAALKESEALTAALAKHVKERRAEHSHESDKCQS